MTVDTDYCSLFACFGSVAGVMSGWICSTPSAAWVVMAVGRGDGPVAASLPVRVPDFRETVEKKSIPQIRRAIAEGRGIMPAFGPALRPAEITDMVQMVRFLSREGRNISWWEKYDTLVVAHCNVPWELVLGYDEPEEEKQP